MVDKKAYIVNGRVEREKIAMDIKRLILSKSDLMEILSWKEVQDVFIGDHFSDRVPRSEWNEKYLDRLLCAVVAEAFNPEYLYYLNEVAEYVNARNKKDGNVKLVVGVAVIAVAVVVLAVVVIK